MTAVFKPGATALITGGASGVGYAFARICRKHGMNLALVDINADNLEKAQQQLSREAQSNEKTETYTMDVSQFSAWQSLHQDVTTKFGSVDLLMLNAGTSIKPKDNKPWEDPDYHAKTYGVNVFGVVNGIAAFLPGLQKKDSPSTIVITGSKQGITNPPGSNPAYNASKATIKHLAEHLAHDMRTQSPQIAVHLLIPGWTFTSFSGNSGPVSDDEARAKKPEGAWFASQCAQYGFEKMGDGKFYIVCPDNDVPEELDQARMTWAAGDVAEGRAALSRWDPGFKDEAAGWIKREAERRAARE